MKIIIAVAGLLFPLSSNAESSDAPDKAPPNEIVIAFDCNDAVDNYNNAVSEISNYYQRYGRCVSSSNALDDCSTEFRRLKNAHDDFETAVSDYRINCM